MAAEQYRPRQHINRVLAASNCRHSARLVLEILCRLAKFEAPEVIVTKNQIGEQSGLHPDTVRAAMRELKEAGTIVPIRNQLGGRGNAVTYRLVAVASGPSSKSQGALDAASSAEPATIWDRIAAQAKTMKPADWRAWLAKVHFGSCEGSTLHLICPNAFVADYCRRELADFILEIASTLDPAIRRVEFHTA